MKSKNQLLVELPTEKLLAKFGSGNHKPGSGSAAALLGLVSCKLLQTVVTLTGGREAYADVQDQLSLVNQKTTAEVEPFLLRAIEDDSIQFARVVEARRRRDAAKTGSKQRKVLAERALDELRVAADLPLEIASHCLDLADRALVVFDLGFQSARGDSGVAVSAALSGAFGSLFIVFLNLTSFKGSEWAVRTRKRAEEQQVRANQIQLRLFQAMSRLHHEVLEKEQPEQA